MNVAEYFESVKDRILADSRIFDFKILKHVDRSKNGHFRARVFFTDGSQLEFSEFIEQSAENEIHLVTYSYHWSDENNNLIRHWDNAPHSPKFENAPHHIHLPRGETDEEVAAGAPTNIFAILDEIAKIVDGQKGVK